MQQNVSVYDSCFKGRNIELAQGINLLNEIDKKILLIAGEAGVGKTRYLQELVNSVNKDSDYLIFSGKNNSESKNDDRTLIDLLNQLVSFEKKNGYDEVSVNTIEIANGLSEELHSLIRNQKKIIFIIEDIHWASRKQLEVLLQLFANLKLPGIKYCFTYRDNENSSGEFNSFIKEISSLSYSNLIYLKPLSASVFSAIINYELSCNIENEDTLVSLLHKYCQGNPLKLRLLILHCLKNGIVTKNENSIQWNSELAEQEISKLDLFTLINERINSLDNNLQQILRLYALIEEEIPYNESIILISSILGFEKNDVERLLKHSIEDQLLYKFGEQLFFTHDKFKEALINYNGESHTVLHYRIAQFFKDTKSDSILLIAYHLAKGSSMIINYEERKVAIGVINKASEILIERNLPEQATWHCEVGVSLCDAHSKDMRNSLLLKAAHAQILTGDYVYSGRILENLWREANAFLEKSSIIELYVQSYSRQKDKEKVLHWFHEGVKICSNEHNHLKEENNPDLYNTFKQLWPYVNGDNKEAETVKVDATYIDQWQAKLLSVVAEFFYSSDSKQAKMLIASSMGLISGTLNGSKNSPLFALLNKSIKSDIIDKESSLKSGDYSPVLHKGEVENLKQQVDKLNIKEAELSNLLIEREREIENLHRAYMKNSIESEGTSSDSEIKDLSFMDSRWNLSRREREICQMIRDGKTSKDIGIELNISYRTVDTYRNRIRKKFELSRTVSLEEYLNQ